jgi:hypothetical protein
MMSKSSMAMTTPSQRGIFTFSILFNRGLNSKKQNNEMTKGKVTVLAILRAATTKITAMMIRAVLPASRGAWGFSDM